MTDLKKLIAHTIFEDNKRSGLIYSEAAWQREQLLTDEAINRLAQSIWERSHGRTENPVTWESTYEPIRELWRGDARAAITALLGEES